jgi:hypothetical protein
MAQHEVKRAGRAADFPTYVGEVRSLRERMCAPEVVFLERLEIEAVGQETARKRRPDDHAEAAFEREREQPFFLAALQCAVLELQRRDRADGERAFDELGRMVGKPAVPNLSLCDQLVDRTPRLFDRHRAVDVVRLQQLDVVTA